MLLKASFYRFGGVRVPSFGEELLVWNNCLASVDLGVRNRMGDFCAGVNFFGGLLNPDEYEDDLSIFDTAAEF